ncbi:adenylyltransferase/cytidyltransferase family protein [bacterium]|nr:adenylyltransferase/cytidyltransferase family protein [bacterium]
MNKIGVLGGTFDPPHDAHLEIARRSISQFGLNKVIFIPSGNPWQKKDSSMFSIGEFISSWVFISIKSVFEKLISSLRPSTS